MSSKDNIARLHQSIKAINHGDVEGFLAVYASTCLFHDRPGGGTNTFEQARQNAVEALATFPDLHVTVEDLITQGEKVVVRTTYRATHTGPLGEIPPTGKQVKWAGIGILHFVDGKVVEDWSTTDLLGLMQQIGAFPAHS